MWLIATLLNSMDLKLGEARPGVTDGVVPLCVVIETIRMKGVNKMGREEGWGLETGAYQYLIILPEKEELERMWSKRPKGVVPYKKNREENSKGGSGRQCYLPSTES